MRVKRGTTTRAKHSKIRKETKGMIKVRRASVKKGNEAILIAREHAYISRKLKKRQFRGLWITRLNAALREDGLSYSKFMGMAKKKNIELDRKSLSELAVNYPKDFKKLVSEVIK